jgi:hypothetical protein
VALGPREASASSPRLALDAGGRAVLAWISSSARGIEVTLAEEQASGAFATRVASGKLPTGAGAVDPVLVTGPRGEALVAWRAVLPSETAIVAAERAPAGAWRDPESASALSFAPNAVEAAAAYGPDGELIVVWNQWYAGKHFGIALARRAPGAPELVRPRDAADVLSPDVEFSNDPFVAVGPGGEALVAWFQSVGGPLGVFVRERSSAEETFGRARADEALFVPAAPGLEARQHAVEDTVVALGPGGRAAVAWRGTVAGTTSAVYLAERDAERKWQKPASLDDSFSDRADRVDNVRVAFAPAGDLYVAWQEHRGEDIAVMLTHRLPDGRWLAGGRAPLRLSQPGLGAIDPRLAVGASGRVAVAWTELHPAHWGIRVRTSAASRTEPTEEGRWTPAVVLRAAGSTNAAEPALAVGGARDRLLVAWTQEGRVQVAESE